MVRKGLVVFFALALGVVIYFWSLITYGVAQGWGQLKVVTEARPVEEFLEDPAFPDSLKRKLRLIDEIRAFAIDSLGLRDTDNYRTLYDQKGQEIMWVVTACEPFRLEPKRWKFPVVGTIPYKGYFNRDKAVAEATALKDAGYDVAVRNPGGWSTLGWFTDPILSGMLNRSEGDLASLIIHEMVHATLWVPDSVDFNENLASFIGDTASYDFLKWKYGADSKEYTQYLYEDQDYRKFSRHILVAAQKLDSLYQTMRESDPVEEKKKSKEAMIRRIVSTMDTLRLHLNPTPSKRYEKRLPNNTYFMTYRHYQSKQNEFALEFNQNFKGDLRAYIHFLADKYRVD
jgi:predicted aminopeptidase